MSINFLFLQKNENALTTFTPSAGNMSQLLVANHKYRLTQEYVIELEVKRFDESSIQTHINISFQAQHLPAAVYGKAANKR